MGIADFFSSFLPELHAEAPPAAEEENLDDGNEAGEQEDESEEETAEEQEEGEGEEEEEEEPEDVKPKLEEECANSSTCASAKHHFEACVERVTQAEQNPDHKGPKEDCVEEFFHLQHCATQCAAPKLWRMLK